MCDYRNIWNLNPMTIKVVARGQRRVHELEDMGQRVQISIRSN